MACYRPRPHIFRHSRATNLANKLTEAQMKEYFGCVQDSKMASIYVHLSGRDTDNAILTLYGRKKKDEGTDGQLMPARCVFCEHENPAAHAT